MGRICRDDVGDGYTTDNVDSSFVGGTCLDFLLLRVLGAWGVMEESDLGRRGEGGWEKGNEIARWTGK